MNKILYRLPDGVVAAAVLAIIGIPTVFAGIAIARTQFADLALYASIFVLLAGPHLIPKSRYLEQ